MHPVSKLTHNWLAKKIDNEFVCNSSCLMEGLVLDLGCGTRPYENEILKFADHYIGVDWSNTLHGFVADVMADLSEPLPIRTESVDVVVCFEVIEHLKNPFLMVEEAFRSLKRGGKIYVSVPFQWHEHEIPWDYYRFTRYGLKNLFEKSGFISIEITEKSGFWVMWILKLNYQLLSLIKGGRMRRRFTRACLLPIWWLGQHLAPKLDSMFGGEGNSIGYFVVAQKP